MLFLRSPSLLLTPNADNKTNQKKKKQDKFLTANHKWRKTMARDGACLFRAFSEHVYHCQANHAQVRAACMAFLKANKDDFAGVSFFFLVFSASVLSLLVNHILSLEL